MKQFGARTSCIQTVLGLSLFSPDGNAPPEGNVSFITSSHCQARQLVDLRNVVDWLTVDVPPGDPLQWLALSAHVLCRVPKLPWAIDWAKHHASTPRIATWASVRGFSAWELECVIACLTLLAPRCVSARVCV